MNPSIDPFDELAALFLTEPDDALRGSDRSGAATTELLLVGHLPVRAGVWLAPYADALARGAGPTALLRLDDSTPHLQVLRGAELPDDSLTLRQSIETMRSDIRLWIIRPATDEPARSLVSGGPKRVTILTGADEAALVAAYQTIKQLAAAAEDSGNTLPALGISVMGCDESTAHSAVKRLNQTTHSFLGVELSLVLCLPRMDAGMISSGYRRFSGERCPAVADVLRWIGSAPPAAAAPPAPSAVPAPAPAPASSPAPPAHAAPAAPEQVALPPVVETIRGVAETGPPPDAPPAAAAVPATARLAPMARVEVEPKRPAVPREPDDAGRPMPLAHHIEGLEPLPVRCPGAEDIELAVDTAGRTHLLGRESAFRRMPVVRRWVFEHREIIAMACPGHSIDGRLTPRMHLFTSTPPSVADLHASGLQLHVLTPVPVGETMGWYTSPLNRT